MAQVINLRENEYQTIKTELEKMHTDQLQSVAGIIREMKALVTSGDTFLADKTSPKIEDMLNMLSNDVIMLLKQAFHDSEAGITNMIKSAVVTDSVYS